MKNSVADDIELQKLLSVYKDHVKDPVLGKIKIVVVSQMEKNLSRLFASSLDLSSTPPTVPTPVAAPIAAPTPITAPASATTLASATAPETQRSYRRPRRK